MREVRARVAGNPLLVDGLIAAGLTALSVITLAAGARDIGSYSESSIVLLLLQTVPLVVRRVAPVPVFIVTATATLLHAVQAEGSLNTTLGSLIALFTVGEYAERRVSLAAFAVLAIGMGGFIIARGGVPQALGGFVQTELSLVACWVLGSWARERRVYIGTVEDRASRAEREREAEAERAVTQERQRIARELHDVVTHHVSVIVIQAGATLRALERRPADAREAVQAIDATARLALADMRRMLGILGTAPGTRSDDGTPEPMPGLDRLGELLESVRAAGLPVELSIGGTPRLLEPGVELSAYRIVQEALTNTLKHAHGARARVEVRYESETLEVRVADRGGRAGGLGAFDSGGRGLIGMRERVAMFGGAFDAGPSDGGFRVVARLPLEAATVEQSAAGPR